jgi:hypothetical protein
MIFESEQQIYDAIKSVLKVPEWVNIARENHKTYKALVYGEKFVDLLLKIEHLETDKRSIARKKYARSIKDIVKKILAPADNVFTANGGSIDIRIENDELKSLFINKMNNVREGKSIEQWLQTFFIKDLYVVDPNGLMLFEWKDEATWLTYKSINAIRYYKATGMAVDYVVFEPVLGEENVNEWRVIDDAKDYCIRQDGNNFSIVIEKTFDLPFNKIPARIISDRKRLGSEVRLSALEEIIETLKEFMRDRNILTMHKFLHGFSTPYRPVIICPECHGTGKKGIDKCGACAGTGKILEKDVTDEIFLPIDLTSERPLTLPNNFAGFISPDLEIWRQYRQEGKDLYNEGFEATWGTVENESKDQTAMGMVLNTQPMISSLHKWSDVVEKHDIELTKLNAQFHLKELYKDDCFCKTYGRNYIVQPPDFLFKNYTESVTKGVSITILDKQLNEYLASKYKNDPLTLQEQLTKVEIEPYVHYDITTVSKIYGLKEARKKGWFTDFWESLKQSEKLQPIEILESKRDAFFTAKESSIDASDLLTNNNRFNTNF